MKQRLDTLLVERGFFETREKAKGSIMAGVVFVNNLVSDKPGMNVDTQADIFIKENPCPYVSRGGLKLKKAIDYFSLTLSGAVCIDIGASTGGFTDCMLHHGAARVYSIDVGYGQLDWKLRNDPRVINMEKENVRYMPSEKIPEKADFISIDVSFISVNLIFPVAAACLKDSGKIVCLIKPQFEAGREQVGKKGIVKEPSIHEEVIAKVMRYAQNAGLEPNSLTFSPVVGAKGNIEYLLLLSKNQKMTEVTEKVRSFLEENQIDITSTVKEAYITHN